MRICREASVPVVAPALDVRNITGGEFCLAPHVPATRSVLCIAISVIVRRSPLEKMIGIQAKRRVTPMADAHAGRNFSIVKLERHPMNETLPPINRDGAIPGSALRSRPKNAPVGLGL